MGGLLFGGILILALGAVAAKKLKARAVERARDAEVLERPGMSPARPFKIASFRDMDYELEIAQCPCGGDLEKLGEGGRVTPQGPVRIARCECEKCGRQIDLFFDLSELRH